MSYVGGHAEIAAMIITHLKTTFPMWNLKLVTTRTVLGQCTVSAATDGPGFHLHLCKNSPVFFLKFYALKNYNIDLMVLYSAYTASYATDSCLKGHEVLCHCHFICRQLRKQFIAKLCFLSEFPC